MASFTLPEEAKIVEALAPATDAAGRTGDYVSLKNAHKVYAVVQITQGNAATVAITPYQATAVAGTSEKVITTARIWSNLSTATSDTLVRRTDAANYTTDAGLANKLVVIEIDPATLDVANGFDCITIKTGASNVANITAATYYLVPRYQGSSMPSAITD